jgi:hypothetical protein
VKRSKGGFARCSNRSGALAVSLVHVAKAMY